MNVITAHYDGKVLVPDHPVDLPTGVPLRLVVNLAAPEQSVKPIWQMATEIGAAIPKVDWADVPTDAARNLDHYLYGSPRDDQ